MKISLALLVTFGLFFCGCDRDSSQPKAVAPTYDSDMFLHLFMGGRIFPVAPNIAEIRLYYTQVKGAIPEQPLLRNADLYAKTNDQSLINEIIYALHSESEVSDEFFDFARKRWYVIIESNDSKLILLRCFESKTGHTKNLMEVRGMDLVSYVVSCDLKKFVNDPRMSIEK